MSANGVLCLEGEWDSDMRKRSSVLPMLEMLEQLRRLKYIHRSVATTGEAEFHLTRWLQRRYDDYRVLYLAAHGDEDGLWWSGRQGTSLEQLAEVIGPSAQGCYVHLGSCLTLFDVTRAQRFVRDTGVAALTGYRKESDWLESAALEMVLLPQLANHTGRPATVFNRLMDRHRDVAKLYKFSMVTEREVLRSQDAPRRED